MTSRREMRLRGEHAFDMLLQGKSMQATVASVMHQFKCARSSAYVVVRRAEEKLEIVEKKRENGEKI
jgi:hypothetical protein